jgi:transcriptional regulator with XRE-family HTH domain
MATKRAVKELRERAGYSQSELAEKLGVDVAAVKNWDGKRRRPRFETLVDLAKALGVTLEELTAAFEADQAKKRKRGK